MQKFFEWLTTPGPNEKSGWSPRENGPKNPPKGPSTLPVWPKNHPNAQKKTVEG